MPRLPTLFFKKIIITAVFRIHIHQIRIQPKISIQIRIQVNSYHYLKFCFNYFIIIRFSHQNKSIKRHNIVKVTNELKEWCKSR